VNDTKLVSYLLEKEEIILPTVILKQKIILEFEENLRKEKPFFMRNFCKNVVTRFDEYIDIKGIDKILNLITELFQHENFQQCISTDDKKIIDFLVKETKLKDIKALEIIGPQFFTFQVVDDLEKSGKGLTKILKIMLLMCCFVNIYELILHEIDRRLLTYPKLKEYKNGSVDRFIKKVNRDEYKDHATAGLINEVLCKILNLREDNNSIFGKSAKPRLIRNKISHSGMFYDSEKNKVILLNGQEYSVEEFLGEYYKIFNFLFNWINMLFDGNLNKEKIISDLKKLFEVFSSEYLKIERSGLSKQYASWIIKVKKDLGVQNGSN